MNKKPFTNLVSMINYVGASYQNPQAFNFLENGKWTNISTAEFTHKIKFLALALEKIGLKKNDNFAIISRSNPIWLMMDFAVIASGAVSVPIFSEIALQNLLFEISDANVKFVFCDSEKSLAEIKNCGRKIEKIIIHGFEYTDENDHEKIIKFSDLILEGEKINAENPDAYRILTKNINENDLATIIYTSGSTGVPKGVEITHKNLISQINGAAQFFPLSSDHDKALSFLPLAHIFERMVVSYYISSGISIYFADDIKNLGNIILEIRPTLMTVVPRVLEKVYNKMKKNVEDGSFIKKIIGLSAFDFALKINVDNCFKKFLLNFFDSLVYKKLRLALGGKFRMMICGGAALSLNMERFYKNIGINLYVGYGATEASPVIAANSYANNKFSTVGKPFPDIKVKLNSKNELLARGANIMKSYHNDQKKTSEVIDKEGWLNTGDLASIDEDGYIKIIGRSKELFKTAGGKYVSPVPIEQGILINGEFLAAVMIIAEGRKFVSCLLFPDFEILEKYKKKLGINLSDEDFLNSKIVEKKIAELINSANTNLNKWEQIKKYFLIKDKISIESGELTPSLKLRRTLIEDKYSKVIDGFYEE